MNDLGNSEKLNAPAAADMAQVCRQLAGRCLQITDLWKQQHHPRDLITGCLLTARTVRYGRGG